MFANISTAIITYIELKDVASLTKPSYIVCNRFVLYISFELPNLIYILPQNQSINNDDNKKNKIYAENIDIIMSLLLNGAKEGLTENELMSFLKITDKISLNRYLVKFSYLHVK